MRIWHWFTYLLYVLVELHRGAWQLAVDMATPGSSRSAAVNALPLRCRTDLEISALASSITITPGTLVVGTAADDDALNRGERVPDRRYGVDELRPRDDE